MRDKLHEYQTKAFDEVVADHADRHARIMAGEELQRTATPGTLAYEVQTVEWWAIASAKMAREAQDAGDVLQAAWHGAQASAYSNAVIRLNQFIAGGDSQEELDLFGESEDAL